MTIIVLAILLSANLQWALKGETNRVGVGCARYFGESIARSYTTTVALHSSVASGVGKNSCSQMLFMVTLRFYTLFSSGVVAVRAGG